MITNQGKELLYRCYSQLSSQVFNPPPLLYLVNLSSEKYASAMTSSPSIKLLQTNTNASVSSTGKNGTGVVLGNGTGVVSQNDVELFAYLNMNGLTTSIQKSYTEENGKTIFTHVITLNNTSSDAIEITEIGYQHSVTYYKNGTSGSTATGGIVLIDHTMLDTPLVIEPSNQGIIEYKIETNWN